MWSCDLSWRECVCLWSCVKRLERSLYVGVCAMSLEEFVCGVVCTVVRGVLYVEL